MTTHGTDESRSERLVHVVHVRRLDLLNLIEGRDGADDGRLESRVDVCTIDSSDLLEACRDIVNSLPSWTFSWTSTVASLPSFFEVAEGSASTESLPLVPQLRTQKCELLQRLPRADVSIRDYKERGVSVMSITPQKEGCAHHREGCTAKPARR